MGTALRSLDACQPTTPIYGKPEQKMEEDSTKGFSFSKGYPYFLQEGSVTHEQCISCKRAIGGAEHGALTTFQEHLRQWQLFPHGQWPWLIQHLLDSCLLASMPPKQSLPSAWTSLFQVALSSALPGPHLAQVGCSGTACREKRGLNLFPGERFKGDFPTVDLVHELNWSYIQLD